MTTQKFQLTVSGFQGGLNTEASAMNILPNEFMDGSVNFHLNQNGSVSRRRGIDFIGASDSGQLLHDIRTNSLSSSEVLVESPSAFYVKLTAPNGDLIERVILDIDNEFRIFDATREGLRNFDVPLQTIARTNFSASNQTFYTMQYAHSGNKLFFAGRHTQPGFLSVNANNINFDINYFDVIIRDPDARELNDRVQRTISGIIRWFECIENHTSDATNRPGDGTGVWQRYWLEKFAPLPTTAPPTWAISTAYTTTIIKRYNADSALTNSDIRPTTVEFFAGRVWLAGDPKFPNEIYFSQVIERDDDVSRYMSFADPFDTDDPDIVDDDGGVIRLQGAGLVHRLIAVSGSLFVGTNTGIFQIAGNAGIFKATEFSNTLVLDDKIEGSNSMVKVGQELIVFGLDSIWLSVIERNLTLSSSGDAAFFSLSEAKMNSLYESIPRSAKGKATAVYNGSDKHVTYFYNATETTFDRARNGNNQPVHYTNVLCFDTRFINRGFFESEESSRDIIRRVEGAFFTFDFTDNAHQNKPFIGIPFLMPEIITETSFVTSGTNLVEDDNQNIVVAAGSGSRKDMVALLPMRYFTGATVTIQAGFGVMTGPGLQDWISDPSLAESYISKLIFGLQTAGDIRHRKGGAYMYMIFERVESFVLDSTSTDISSGSGFLRSAWKFAEGSKAADYGPPEQVYRATRYYDNQPDGSDPEVSHVRFMKRVRGTGNVQQFILESDGNRDLHLVGWNYQFWRKND